MRRAYAHASREYGVVWFGRNYDRSAWQAGDPVNRALSAANACLNSLCHAAIVSAGYSPGLGFIHTGKQLSFVYDVADLYKTRLTVPLAFRMTSESPFKLETRIRQACRDLFFEQRLMARILDDLDGLLNLTQPFRRTWASRRDAAVEADEEDFDVDPALPGAFWDGASAVGGEVPGGVSYGGDDFGDGADFAAGGIDAVDD